MTPAPDLGRAIVLVPVEGAVPLRLHRALARQVWRDRPLGRVRYDSREDRLLVRLIDAPSVAEGMIANPDGADTGMFAGFDGMGPDAWPTTIAQLGFADQCRSTARHMQVLRELIGPDVWAAALAAVDGPERTLEVAIPPGRTSYLVTRWRQLIVAAAPAILTDEALSQVLAEWGTTLPVRLTRSPGPVKAIRRRICVDGDELFRQLTGRPRRPLEPWPMARVDFDAKGGDYLISVVLPVPELPAQSQVVSAQLSIEDQVWDLILEPEPGLSSLLIGVLIGCRLVDAQIISAVFLEGGQVEVGLKLRVTNIGTGHTCGG